MLYLQNVENVNLVWYDLSDSSCQLLPKLNIVLNLQNSFLFLNITDKQIQPNTTKSKQASQ